LYPPYPGNFNPGPFKLFEHVEKSSQDTQSFFFKGIDKLKSTCNVSPNIPGGQLPDEISSVYVMHNGGGQDVKRFMDCKDDV
jgi:hypothetical protein